MSTKVLGNQHVTVRAGLASGISNWANPLLSEITGLTDVSGAVNWDSFDLNVKASDQKDDRTLTDGAGAQSRSPYVNFGGNLQFVSPPVTDSSSIYRTAANIFRTATRVQLAVAVRYGPLNSTAPAHGDKWTVYHVESDIIAYGANDVSRYYQVSLVAQDDIVCDYIVPNATPATPVITALETTGTASAGTIIFASAAYEGWDITKMATWTSSDPTKLVEIHPGIFQCVAAGSPTITCSYPGAAAATPVSITVT